MLTPNLVSWQWTNYPNAHRDRRNLLLHALTAPLLVAGLVALVAGVATAHVIPALAGASCIAIALAAQGRGHALEAVPPVPFRSPLDAIARLIVEQLVTFPRFVLSGHFAEAWRRGGEATSR